MIEAKVVYQTESITHTLVQTSNTSQAESLPEKRGWWCAAGSAMLAGWFESKPTILLSRR